MLAAGVVALSLGRVNLDVFKPIVVSALQDRLGPNYVLSIGALGIEREPRGLALAVEGVAISRADGRRVVSTPKADLIFDPLALLAGRIKPSRVDIDGLDVTLRVLPDGTLDLTAAGEPAPAAPKLCAATTRARGERTERGAPDQRAGAREPRESDAAGRQCDQPGFRHRRGPRQPDRRARSFRDREWAADRRRSRGRAETRLRGVRIFAGPQDRRRARRRPDRNVGQGPERALVARGRRARRPRRGHELAIQGDGFSIDEIALMAGKTSVPIDSDIPLSFKAAASFEGDGHVLDADARLALGQGFWRFDDPDFAPVFVDEVFAAAHWDAAGHRALVDRRRSFPALRAAS